MTGGIIELAVIIIFVASLGVIAALLRQPVVLAYLATGIIIGYFGLFNFANKEFFRVFSDLGIMFLLFLIGLEINYTSLRLVGRTSLIVGTGQVIFTSIIGFFIAKLLGFASLHAVYVAVALTFSSTIIVVKILSDKKDLNSLYGKISVGFLLVQDFIAIIILIALSGAGNGGLFAWTQAALALIKGIALFALMFMLGRRVMPKLFNIIAHSQELLFLLSLAWVFFIVAFMQKIGLSIEIGGFLAGIALANSSEHFQIAGRVKSLRDFFILIFFVILGSSLIFSDFAGLTLPTIIFSLFVLIGNPLIVMVIMGSMGYRKRTSFLSGITVAQISEFSLILAALGLRSGHIDEGTAAIITATGIITITGSTYLMVHAEKIFSILSPALSFLEKQMTRKEGEMKDFRKSLILIGFHRTGKSLALQIPKKDLLVIDFDPEIIKQLQKHGINYIFGDITDPEVQMHANFDHARMIISTSPDLKDNLGLLLQLKNLKQKGVKFILRARTEYEAEILYANGCDYVLLPHLAAGYALGKIIAQDPKGEFLEMLRKRDLEIIYKKEEMLT